MTQGLAPTTGAAPWRQPVPATVATVDVVLRMAVAVDEAGGHLQPEVAVSITTNPHAAPAVSALAVPVEDLAAVCDLCVDGALRARFDATHPKTSAIIADLSARSEQFLAGLRMGEDPAEVVLFGQALEVVHRELAGADRMCREWIVRQGYDLRSALVRLTSTDLVRLKDRAATLPADTPVPAGAAQELVRDYGVLVTTLDGEASGKVAVGPVTVYRRAPQTAVGETELVPGAWVRDGALTELSANGSASSSEQDTSAAGERVTLMRRQLELLGGSDEYARLAATHERGAEMAALEQETRLLSIPLPRRPSS